MTVETLHTHDHPLTRAFATPARTAGVTALVQSFLNRCGTNPQLAWTAFRDSHGSGDAAPDDETGASTGGLLSKEHFVAVAARIRSANARRGSVLAPEPVMLVELAPDLLDENVVAFKAYGEELEVTCKTVKLGRDVFLTAIARKYGLLLFANALWISYDITTRCFFAALACRCSPSSALTQ